MHDEGTRVLKAAQSIVRLLDEGRARTGLSRHPFFTQALRVWEAISRLADMDEFLNEACVGVEKAIGEIGKAFAELSYQASRNYYDVLGMVYMLAQLGSKGEEFTPHDLVRLLVRLNLEGFTPSPPGGPPLTIYDPCCGSGSLLLGAAEFIDEVHPELLDAGQALFYGQEISYDAWLMARLNMRLHLLPRRIWQAQYLSPGERLALDQLTDLNQSRTSLPGSGLLCATRQPPFPAEDDQAHAQGAELPLAGDALLAERRAKLGRQADGEEGR